MDMKVLMWYSIITMCLIYRNDSMSFMDAQRTNTDLLSPVQADLPFDTDSQSQVCCS